MTKLRQNLRIIFGCFFGRHRPITVSRSWHHKDPWTECQDCGHALEQTEDGKWHVL